jgi:hypothetical protein
LAASSKCSSRWPYRVFRDIFREKFYFSGQSEIQRKIVLFLGRPGIRFATPKIITKGAKISQNFREN